LATNGCDTNIVECQAANRLTLNKPQQHALFRDFPPWVTPIRQNNVTREEKIE
jgi:hypothetical protein